MAVTYKIRGGDGREYGPVALDQIESWLREGRVNAQTEMTRSDMTYWAPAGQFTEFQNASPATAAVPVSPPPLAAAGAATAQPNRIASYRVKSGARWFFWLAGLSVVNSVMAASRGGVQFIFGLGITQLLDGQDLGAISLALTVLVAGVFVLFGVFAQKRQPWAFIAGMILYTLDGLLLVLVSAWIPAAVHAYVLYRLFVGFRACRDAD